MLPWWMISGSVPRSARSGPGRDGGRSDLAGRAGFRRWSSAGSSRAGVATVPVGKLPSVWRQRSMPASTVFVRWHGGDLPRLLGARHASDARGGWPGFFAIYRRLDRRARGVVLDLRRARHHRCPRLAPGPTDPPRHRAEDRDRRRHEMLGTLDRKRRLAIDIARDRGWWPAAVATWVVIATPGDRTDGPSSTTRTVLRAKLPVDGRTMRAWLRSPEGPVDAMSFMPSVRGMHLGSTSGPIRRVVKRRPKRGTHDD